MKRKELGFKPMAMHKQVIINWLKEHPEDVEEMCPGWHGSAQGAITRLEADEWCWMVGDRQMTQEEYDEYSRQG
jgi:hypothetical protein